MNSYCYFEYAFEILTECEGKHLHNFIHTLFLSFIKSLPANYDPLIFNYLH